MNNVAIPSNVVYCSVAPYPGYGPIDPIPAPELRSGRASSSAAVAFRQLLHGARLDADRYGTPEWNPLGEIIRPGSRVLLKPNWVHHENHSGRGLECLVTHVSILDAVLLYLEKTRPRRVIIGDAPVQGCDFGALVAALGVESLVESFRTAIPEIEVRDFRLAELVGARSWSRLRRTGRAAGDYVLFDLGRDSLLEPLSSAAGRFRVTMYDPRILQANHAPGRHRYLIARDAVDADVVLNLPKLKTHKKAGVTGAIKNAVGINGSKDYLAHHRKGSAVDGGDCYPERSLAKAWAESTLDAMNRANARVTRYLLAKLAAGLRLSASIIGHGGDLEGSWYGNDTVWRMSLDIQRILHYGCPDGLMSDSLQRRVVTITDAIVAGEGEGPLAPSPVSLGLLTMGSNVAALEWVHARLMGFDPAAIPIVREAFAPFRHPLADFGPPDLRIILDGREIPLAKLAGVHGRAFQPSAGWRDHCDTHSNQDAAC
jgi:uncharacterized protein (DUF362 family)